MSRRQFAIPRAFTLIEVLIGILILAIALLGLGAVIPVVVKAQRQASDATQGLVAIEAAEAYLRNNPELNCLKVTPSSNPSPPNRAGFGVWLLEPNWSPAGTNADAYLWEPPLTALELDPASGRVTIGIGSSNLPAIVGVAERLWPARNSGGTDPQFVWDFVGRRVLTDGAQPGRLQLALFVRRVDVGIRLPASPPSAYQWTIYDVLTGTVPVGQPPLPAGGDRRPVAVGSPTGYPTNTGVGDYAGMRFASADFNPAARDRLELWEFSTNSNYTNSPADLVLARQLGQRLVDNLGNIYTVRGVYEGTQPPNRVIVLIDPPVPASVPDPAQNPPDERTLRQVVFTPQVPAAVRVVDFTPLDPK